MGNVDLGAAMTRRAVFYIASDDDGGRFVCEAHHSMTSVRKNLPGVPAFLFFSGMGSPSDIHGFDDVRRLPLRQYWDMWYLDSTRFFVRAVKELSDFDELLYLDTDTYVASNAMNIFDLLQQYDYAIGQSPQRDCANSTLDPAPPESFCTLENGVNVFRNSPLVRQFLEEEWLGRYAALPRRYDNNDNGPLRDALWLNRLGLRWCTLAPEFSLRFDFGAWVVGRVRIMHGRIGGISTNKVPLEDASQKINSITKMRMWHHGDLLCSVGGTE